MQSENVSTQVSAEMTLNCVLSALDTLIEKQHDFAPFIDDDDLWNVQLRVQFVRDKYQDEHNDR